MGGASAELDEDAKIMRLVLPQAERTYGVWRENWPALELFLAVSTQWRMGPKGVIGLDYVAVRAVMDWLSIDGATMFRDLQVMEREAVRLLQGGD